MNHTPRALTRDEWDEIARLKAFRDKWGLDDDEDGKALATMSYAAKFDFVSGSPGYVGDLYVLMSDGLSGPPCVLIREHGGLAIADLERV